MRVFNGDQIEAFICDSVLEGLAVAVAEEDDLAALFVPRLGQSQTAHDVARSNLRGGIGPYQESHQFNRLKDATAGFPIRRSSGFPESMALLIMPKTSSAAIKYAWTCFSVWAYME